MAAKKSIRKAAPKKAAPKKVAKKAVKPAPKRAAKPAKKAAGRASPGKTKLTAGTQAKKVAPAKKVVARKPAARKLPQAPAPAPVGAGPASTVEAVPTEQPISAAVASLPAAVGSEPARAPEPRPAEEPPNLTAVKPGDEAPAFELPADDDTTVKLSDYRGRKVVLYFYPRDRTPACTQEAKDFSSLGNEFDAKNTIVFGVSTDDLLSHRRFKHTCDLTVKLLSDPDKVAHLAYGVWREKNMYGRVSMGTVRSTFLIDEEGRIAKVWPKVRTEDHALDVLNSI